MKEEKTNTRIALLEQNHIMLMDLFKTYSEENAKQHENILKGLKDMEDKLDRAIEKKADKVVVDRMLSVLFWFGGIVGTGILGYVGLQIIKVIEKL